MNRLEQEFLQEADNSPSAALELARNMVSWLEHIPDGKYEESDRQAVIIACLRLYKALDVIGQKHLSSHVA
jgi:hypothetical protein